MLKINDNNFMQKMQKYGINKRLRDRRLELDYSTLEAAIRLDITKRYLFLIEHGYLKVKNKALQEKFIRKYKLNKNFFSDDFKGYPTPIEKKQVEIEPNHKFVKFFLGWPFKIATLALTGGFVAMGVIGLNNGQKIASTTPTFFSNNINNLKDFVKTHGTSHEPSESVITALLDDKFYSLDHTFEIATDTTNKTVNASVNFLETDEHLPFTFLRNIGHYKLKSETLPISYYYKLESRYYNGTTRVHFYTYDDTDPNLSYQITHISADLDSSTSTFNYNLVEERNYDGRMIPLKDSTLFYYVLTYMFYSRWTDFVQVNGDLFNFYYPQTQISYDTFQKDLFNGINYLTNYQKTMNRLAIWGLVLSVLIFALFALSCIRSFRWGLKISGGDEKVKNNILTAKVVPAKKREIITAKAPPTPVRQIPYDNWITPFIPEMGIRILVLSVTLISSLCIFYIFQSLLSFDVIGTIRGISFKSEIASLSAIAMILFFFTKLDIHQSRKNSFMLNFVLFFAGLIFYFVILMIQVSMKSTKSMSPYVDILNYLPGNVFWGILALSFLSSTLFSTPKFKKNTMGKISAYRCLSLIPIAYVVVSAIYPICRNVLGWEWPLAVSSIFFSNAFFTAAFTVLYVIFVYVYKKLIVKKYGIEGAEIYQYGNRYMLIKNFLVAVAIALIGIIDLIVGKVCPDNPIGLGSNYLIFVTIPFILLYHPHMGDRNKKWDIIFAGSYGVSMALGYILIASYMSVYIAAI